MFRLYGETAVLAFKRAAKAWPVAFSLVLYALIFAAAAILVRPLGIIGGFLLGFVGAACASGYLYLLSQVVAGLPLKLTDLKRGFGALLWDVVSVMFALWLIGLVVALIATQAGPNGPAIQAIVMLAMAFFLNPVPEHIYMGRSRSFQLLLESSRFVLANPLIWLIPNLLFALAPLAATGALQVNHPGELLVRFGEVFSPQGVARLFARLHWWAWPLLLLYIHYAMVFRGLLFQSLSSGNPRSRAWQARFR